MIEELLIIYELLARLLKQEAECPTCKTLHWFRSKLTLGEAD